jgi:hypothetical protein
VRNFPDNRYRLAACYGGGARQKRAF